MPIEPFNRPVANFLLKRVIYFLFSAHSVSLFALPATAQTASVNINTAASPTTGDAEVDFLIALWHREGGYSITMKNRSGYLGMFQMGEMALASAKFYARDPTAVGTANTWRGQFTDRAKFVRVTSVETFLADAAAQELAVRAYHEAQWKTMTVLGITASIGSTIDGIKITKSGLTAGAHLVGPLSVKAFINSNGEIVPQDGNHVALTVYLTEFSAYF